MPPHYFRPVPGSSQLKTERTACGELEELEHLPPGRFERRQIKGETLGRVVVREGFVPVLHQVFELAQHQTVIEQVLYLHLYRHSYGHEQNYCRMARKELCSTIGLSERRFNRALAGLVQKGHVRMLQRNRLGTLYRVYLPSEIFGKGTGSEVFLGKLKAVEEKPGNPNSPGSLVPAKDKARMSPKQKLSALVAEQDKPSSPPRQKAVPKKSLEAKTKRHHLVMPISSESPAAIAKSLLMLLPPRSRKAAALDALQEVTMLVEEGYSPQRISQVVKSYGNKKRRSLLDFADFAAGELMDGQGD